MEIFNRLESKRFELPKVKSSENAPLCDYCKKREAEYECEQCENETGKTPIRYICERHLDRIRKHEEPNRHNYRKISDYSEDSLVDLMHTSNVHISCLKGQIAQLKGELGETKERIEDHFQRLIQSFTEEVNLHKQKCIREIEAESNKKKNELLSQKSTLERIVGHIKTLSDQEAEKADEQAKEHEEAKINVKDTQNQIYDDAQRAKQYRPSAGPFFRLQPFDENIKRLVRQVIDYDIVTEQIDFNKLKEATGMTKPLVAGHVFSFNVQEIPLWCLRDCPVIMLPHPDLKGKGKLARKLLELQCTAAVESSLVERTTQIQAIHGCSLLKCGDGISRRVILRRIDENSEAAVDPDTKAERNVIELFSPTIANNQYQKKEFVKIANAIDKHVEECASLYSEKHREMLKYPVRGTYGRGGKDCCKFDLKLKNQVSLLLAVQVLKELTAKGKELETISWAIRAKYFLFFIDEIHMAPIPIDLNLPDPLKDLELYGIIDDIDVDSIPPLAIECWVHLNYTKQKDLSNCEPFTYKFHSPDVSAALRTFLDDAKEFKIEFMASIEGTESTNAWLTNVTANKENIAEKVRSYLDVRSHFTVPRKSS